MPFKIPGLKLNAKQYPKIYYGLHMSEGVAEYSENGKPSRIFISNDAICKMSDTFSGKPVVVEHQETDLDNLTEQADGYVVNSFFNKADGKFWAKFIIVSDRGHEAIRNGWKLSNCYEIRSTAGGGRWHNVEYDEEVMDGDFDHLAIVQNPRYEESVILTPEQFREYNAKKESELAVLYNSKGAKKVKFNLFKKQKLENAADLENALVELEDGTEISIQDMVTKVKNDRDLQKAEADKKKKNEIDPGEKVKVGDVDMTVNELIAAYQALLKKHEDKVEDQKENTDKDDDDEDEEKKKMDREKKENEEREKEKLKAAKKENAAKLENAKPDVDSGESKFIDTSLDQMERGRNRYGSGK